MKLVQYLDLVDEQSEHQRRMQEHLSDAFLALARERYRDPAAAVRLASLAPNAADSYVTADGQLVLETGIKCSSLAPLPSPELRSAIAAFRNALVQAVDCVNARKRLQDVDIDAIEPSQTLQEPLKGDDTGLVDGEAE